MRTLKQIDDAVNAAAKAHLEKNGNPFVDVLPAQVAYQMQCEARFNEIYRKMHGILQQVHVVLEDPQAPKGIVWDALREQINDFKKLLKNI